MGAQGAPCSVTPDDASKVRAEVRAEDEQALQMEEQEQAALVVHGALNGYERVSLDRMLDDCYGIPWCLSTLELKLPQEECEDHSHVARTNILIDASG